MMHDLLVAGNELGLPDILFLLVAQRKNHRAVVILTPGGQMEGLWQFQNQVGRVGVIPFLPRPEDEWYGSIL